MRYRRKSLEDGLKRYINKTDTCWVWTGDKYGSGYGRLSIGKGKQVRAHRFMYEQLNGKIPDGLFACHSCDNRLCVNPSHIFIGTQKDNMQDCLKKGRHKYKTLKGVDSPNSKSTNDDIIKIRKLFSTGEYYQRELGEMFGISQATVSKIVLGLTYK